MEKSPMQSFLTAVEQLLQQHQLLKEHAFHLDELNQSLLKENRALKQKNERAKAAVNNVINQLQQEQL